MEYFRDVFGAGSEKPSRDVIVDIPSFAKRKWYSALPSPVTIV